MEPFRYTKDSLPTYHDGRLQSACNRYGSLFQEFTLIEKFNILTALGMWGEHCVEFTPCSLAKYLEQYCPVRNDTDAFDMLVDLSPLYTEARDAMGLIAAVASQISQGIWLQQRGA